MPVLTEIQSSEVSTNLERSSFEISVLGTADPEPTNLEPLPTRLQKKIMDTKLKDNILE
jgi:hypothetical protein